MIETDSRLPDAMRRNNPGDVRARVEDREVFAMKNGKTTYVTLLDGVVALAEQLRREYVVFGCTTPRALLQRLPQAMEGDFLAYENDLAARLMIPVKAMDKHDLHLELAWPLIDVMRTIIRRINGPTAAEFSIGGEWIGLSLMVSAARISGAWGRIE